MTDIEYCRPHSLAEAVRLFRESDKVKILAGGTDLVVQLKGKKIAPQRIIDITYIPELNELEHQKDGSVSIGAAVSLARLTEDSAMQSRFPILCQAARTVGSNQIRQRATLAGNLANASPSADTIPALLVLEAKIRMAGPEGSREVAVAEFMTGPGKTVLQKGEIIKEIILPALPGGPQKALYLKFARRKAVDLAMVGVALLLIGEPDRQICRELRIALGAVAAVPFRVGEAEKVFRGQAFSSAAVSEAAGLAKKAARPISDIRASADYRLDLVESLVKKGIDEVWAQYLS